jgi:antirestriction protein
MPSVPDELGEVAWRIYCNWMEDEATKDHFDMTYRGQFSSPEDFAKYYFLCHSNSEEWVAEYFDFPTFLEELVLSGFLIVTDDQAGDVHVFDTHY